MVGGESGIRTHGTFDSTQAFQACALNRSAISPIQVKRLAGGFSKVSQRSHKDIIGYFESILNLYFYFNWRQAESDWSQRGVKKEINEISGPNLFINKN